MGISHITSTYRPEIDGLRALAVIAVFVGHFDKELLPSGYLGVDIFFVISGYVITLSLMARRHDSVLGFLLEFYARRVKRLVPALVLFVVVGSVFTWLLHPVPHPSLLTGFAALLGISNIQIYRAGAGYFSPLAETNVFLHTWSLGVEEQFYLLFPALVWWSSRGRYDRHSVGMLMWLTAALSLVSLTAFAMLYHRHNQAAYFLLPTRFWELGTGCFLALATLRPNKLTEMALRIPPTLVAACLVAVLFAPSNFAAPATVACVALSAILIASLRSGTLAYSALVQRHVVFIGLISYSLYLWHWPVLRLASFLPGNPEWWLPLVQFALAFLLAAASFVYVERPLRHAKWFENRSLTIGCGALAAAAGCAMLMALATTTKFSPSLLANATHVRITWWENRTTGRYLEKCHVYRELRPDIVQECLNTAAGPKGTVYLIGDSYARNYLQAVRSVFQGYSVAYLTMGHGCAYLPRALAQGVLKVNCLDYVSEVDRHLDRRIRHGDIIVIGQRLDRHPSRQSSEYIDFVRSAAVRFARRGARVVLLDATVPPRNEPELCIGQNATKPGCFVEAQVVAEAYNAFDRLAADASRQIANLYYAPLRLGLCEGDRCGQTLGGTAVWHDRGHITETASRLLASLLRDRLTESGFFDAAPSRR